MKFASRLSIVVLAVAGLEARAAEIDFNFDPNRHNRFLSGFGTLPVQNPNVLGGGLDFSGVGWSTVTDAPPFNIFNQPDLGINVAMVTPRHFITADHYRPTVGSSVKFLGSDGVVRSYTVDSYIPLRYDPPGVNPSNRSDLIVGQLVETIQPTDNIKIYSVLRPGAFQYPFGNTPQEIIDFYRGKQMVVVGKNDTGGPGFVDANGDGFNDRGGKIGVNIIDDLGVYNFGTAVTNTVGVGFESPSSTPDAARIVGGDSGSPSFILYNGQLYALGSHSGADFNVNPQYNIDGFLPYYFDQINQLIASTGFQMTAFNPVPEPSTFAMIAAAGAGLYFLRRKRSPIPA
jgi:hypothetical protein